jgi:hypothetical protein
MAPSDETQVSDNRNVEQYKTAISEMIERILRAGRKRRKSPFSNHRPVIERSRYI